MTTFDDIRQGILDTADVAGPTILVLVGVVLGVVLSHLPALELAIAAINGAVP